VSKTLRLFRALCPDDSNDFIRNRWDILDEGCSSDVPIYIPDDADDPQVMPPRVFRSGQTGKLGIAVLPVTERSTYFIQFQVIYCEIPFDGERPLREEPIYNVANQAESVTGAPCFNDRSKAPLVRTVPNFAFRR
jgi:hypothetical protein